MPTSRVTKTAHVMGSHPNPTLAFTLASIEAVHNHNEGVDLAAEGQYEAAEQRYLKALDIKIKTMGEDAISTALTHTTLGELYTATNRLDDAEKHLKIAMKIRQEDAKGPTFDAAMSRENLAVVYEMRGNLVAAKQIRKSTGKFACGNYRNVHPILSPLDEPALMFVIPYSVRDEFSIRADSDNVPGALYVLFLSSTSRLNTNITCRLFSIVLTHAK